MPGVDARTARRKSAGPAGPPPKAARPFARDDFDRDVWCVLGLPIDRMTTAEAALAVEAAAREGRRLSFVTPNVNWLVRALRDETARRQIVDADLSLADGAPVVLIARLLGVPLRERAAGSDLFEALRLRPGFAGRRLKVFFFGGRPGSAEAAAARVNDERGGVAAVGWMNPGFGEVAAMSGADVIEKINAADPDFVVVSLGAAKGQDWIARNAPRLKAPVLAHLGAVVDFTAGAIPRAPRLFARLGLEWAWRIAAEPALFRRYAGDARRLAAISIRRLLPQLGRARRGAGEAGSARLEFEEGVAVLRLSGRFGGDLGEVRSAFRAAAAAGEVILDIAEVKSVDRAFLGLVLMLEKAVRARGGALRLAGDNPRLAKLFTANAMNYADAGRGADRAPAAPGAARAAG